MRSRSILVPVKVLVLVLIHFDQINNYSSVFVLLATVLWLNTTISCLWIWKLIIFR